MTNERYLRSESARSNRESYLKPLLMMIIAGGITMTIHGISEGLGSALWYPLTFVIEVPIGVGVFFLCCLLWLGFDAPMHLTALRLAGIYAVVDLVAMAVGFIPFFGWLITLFVYIGLLSEMLEMELSDAVLVGFLTFVAKVAVGMGLVLLFANQ